MVKDTEHREMEFGTLRSSSVMSVVSKATKNAMLKPKVR